ncbi:MAG: SPOR domain-containing protein [Gemmatimonadota bacterium]
MNVRAWVGAATLVLAVPADLAAQGWTLDDVEARAAEARLDEARLALELWWDAFDDRSAADRERGLWLRARLTVDPDLAAQDYVRIVLEHPGGSYASRARHRLDQLAEARGERRAAQPRSAPAPLFALELAATDSYARAARVFDDALRAGLSPRLVRLPSDGEDRYRVRVGRYGERDRARRDERRLRRYDFDARVVDDARSETVVRRRGPG